MDWKQSEQVTAALMHIYSFQTPDEKQSHNTKWQNDMGFNAFDAEICTSIAQFYLRCQFLTPKQIAYLRKTLPKYKKQIPENLSPVPFKSVKKGPAKKGPQKKMAEKTGNLIKVTFPYNQTTISQIKHLHKRRWVPDNPADKHWTCPLTLENITMLRDLKFEIDAGINAFIENLLPKKVEKINSIPGLKKELFPYQVKGVEFIESRSGRALIGDDMGLGKTAQALAWLQLHPEARPALIICPASLKLHWRKETRLWMGKQRIQILHGMKPHNHIADDIVIINYDLCAKWRESLLSKNFAAVILDESHYIKNSRAGRSKAIAGWDTKKQVTIKTEKNKGMKKVVTTHHEGIAEKAPAVLCLSGTPITNRPKELFTSINLISPQLFPSFYKFARKYCGATHNGFGWDFNGASNIPELHQKLTESIMIRRKKEEVLPDLPKKTRVIIPLEISNLKKYMTAEADLLGWVQKEKGDDAAEAASKAEQLARFEYLKQLCWEGKAGAAVKWIRNVLESNGKLVVFSTHTKVLDLLEKEFGDITVRIDGKISKVKRDIAENRFQNDPTITLLLGNIKAAGVGLNLQKSCSKTCFLELGWTPGDHIQAEDRVLRIGQTADAVFAYYLIAGDTIEEEIMELLEKKAKIIDQTLDGLEVDAGSIFTDLLKTMKGE